MGLLEIVLAVSLLLLIIVPMSYLFTNVLAQAASARQTVTAISLADSLLETLNYQGPPNDSNGQPEVGVKLAEGRVTTSGVAYTESALFSWSPAGSGTPDLCTAGLAPELLLQVTVTWGSSHTITDSTLLNFPPSGVVTEGFLGIQVNGDPAGAPPVDATGIPWTQRVTHVPVVVSGSGLTTSYSLTPASNGCTFLELAVGTYSVTVGSGPANYTANYNEQSFETQPTSSASTVTVNTDEITEVVFQYDEGADVLLTYPSTTAAEDGLACPNVGSGLTCIVTGQTATSSAAPNLSPLATALVKTSSGWSRATVPSSIVRIESTACSAGVCIAGGYGASAAAAVVAQASSPGTWTASSLPANLTALSQVVCPTGATAPNCFAVGTNTSGHGVILSATVTSSSPPTVTWTLDTVPTVTAFSQLTCPSSSATPACFVIGTAATSNISSFTSGTTWAAYSAPSGVTATGFTSLVCPSTTVCYASGTTSSASVILSLAGGTWTKDTFPASPFSLSTTGLLACPSATQCYATATGKTSSAGSVGPLLLSTTGTAWVNMTLPGTTAAALAQPVCASTSVCFVPALTSSNTPLIWSLSSSSGPWVNDTLPTGLVSLTSVVCPSTTLCLADGTTATAGTILSTTGGSAPTWVSDTISGTTGSPVFLSGLVCLSTTSCEAAGATEQQAFILDDTSSTTPVFSGSGTPSSLVATSTAGMYLDNPPILISNLNLQPSTTLEYEAATTANAPILSIGPLFPFSSGYSVAVGECPSELSTASASASTTPGDVGSPPSGNAAAQVTLPMGLLPIQVVNSLGAAVSGATVTITDTCSSPLTPLSGANPANYSLPNTTVDGLSRADVIYSTYSVTVALGLASATYSLTVSPTSVTVGSTTTYLPNPVVLAD